MLMTKISAARNINPAFGFAILVLGLLASVLFVAARDEDRMIDDQSRQVAEGASC